MIKNTLSFVLLFSCVNICAMKRKKGDESFESSCSKRRRMDLVSTSSYFSDSCSSEEESLVEKFQKSCHLDQEMIMEIFSKRSSSSSYSSDSCSSEKNFIKKKFHIPYYQASKMRMDTVFKQSSSSSSSSSSLRLSDKNKELVSAVSRLLSFNEGLQTLAILHQIDKKNSDRDQCFNEITNLLRKDEYKYYDLKSLDTIFSCACRSYPSQIKDIINRKMQYLSQQLFFAIEKNDEKKVSLLIEDGVPVNVSYRKDFTTYTPLEKAIEKGNVSIVEKLLKAGANPNYGCWVPLLHRVINCEYKYKGYNLAHVKKLLRGEPFWNPIACQLIDLLVANGACVDVYNWEEQTPLYHAILKGKNDIIECLIFHDANLQSNNRFTPSSDERMSTPLELAKSRGLADYVLSLYNFNKKMSPLDKAVYKGASDEVNKLLSESNYSDEELTVALQIAYEKRYREIYYQLQSKVEGYSKTFHRLHEKRESTHRYSSRLPVSFSSSFSSHLFREMQAFEEEYCKRIFLDSCYALGESFFGRVFLKSMKNLVTKVDEGIDLTQESDKVKNLLLYGVYSWDDLINMSKIFSMSLNCTPEMKEIIDTKLTLPLVQAAVNGCDEDVKQLLEQDHSSTDLYIAYSVAKKNNFEEIATLLHERYRSTDKPFWDNIVWSHSSSSSSSESLSGCR